MKISFKILTTIFLGILTSVSLILYLIQSTFFAVQSILITLIASIPIVMGASFVIWVIIRQFLIQPILEINHRIKVIATGNLGKRIDTKAYDEVNELTNNLNTVIDNLATGMQHFANALRDEKNKEKELAATVSQLQAQQAKDKALLTSIGDGIIAIDNSQRIFLFNKAASNLTGHELNEVINQPYRQVLQFFREKDLTPAEDFIGKIFSREKTDETSRMVVKRKDGQVIPISPSTAPILNPAGQLLGVIIVLRNVTRERQLDKLKDEFVSVASHELRTPMTAIKGLISMIFEGDFGKPSEELKDPLQDIATSTDRLIQLVNDILDVSRIEAGRVRITLDDIEIDKVVKEITALIEPLTKQKNISLIVKDFGQTRVKTDPDKIKEVLQNLLGNAVKFTDQGQITVSEAVQGDLLYISVSDTGMGMSPEDKQKLFNKFQQISSTQLGRPIGTGLGLYISREFIRKLGGDLWISQTEPGKGSTFTFTLPLSDTPLAQKLTASIEKAAQS